MPFNNQNNKVQQQIHSEPNSPEVLTNSNTDDLTIQLSSDEDTIKAEPVLKVFAEVVENTLDAAEDTPVSRWMHIAAPILKSGDKTVAVILALGFISIPLMLGGSSLVPLVLAIGASVTAICSSL